jgi:hypothetical protein
VSSFPIARVAREKSSTFSNKKLYRKTTHNYSQLLTEQGKNGANELHVQRFATTLHPGKGVTMYSDETRQRRQCVAIKADGQRCRAFATWEADGPQLCAAHRHSHVGQGHAGRVRGHIWRDGRLVSLTVNDVVAQATGEAGWYVALKRCRRPTCNCGGLPFPHRPGGKGCALSSEPSATADFSKAVQLTPSKEAANYGSN